MQYKIFIEQLKRSKKTVVYLCLLAIATAFFVMSVNLYANSSGNLKVAEEAFSTLAVTELYGEVDKYGNLVERNSEEHIGYEAVGVRGYDFSEFVNSEYVESYDLRTNYGAFIEEHPAMIYSWSTNSKGELLEEYWLMRSNNVIRFKITAEQPMELEYVPPGPDRWTNRGFFGIEVLDEAAACFDYPDRLTYSTLGYKQEEWDALAEEIKAFNQTDDTDKLILQPGVEYIAIVGYHGYWTRNEETGIWEPSVRQGIGDTFSLVTPWQDFESWCLTYDDSKEGVEYQWNNTPFPIQRWEDVQNDPQLKAYFDDLWQDIYVQQRTHNVVATDDVSSVPAFHLGGAELTEGRYITEKEYAEGAKVCLISNELAENQNWKIGDKLNMKIFESDYISAEARNNHTQPIYNGEVTPFVSEGEYEIVGIYSSYEVKGYTELATSTTEHLNYNIYLPTKSISVQRDLSDEMVHGSTFSVKLKNGSIDAFKAEMEEKGITTVEAGKYVPTFHYYDQGYSAVRSSLLSMNSTAKLLLLLSTILLLIVCVLIAYFFWQNQRQTVGIFRMLGGTKKHAIAAVLTCAMILTGVGAVAGGVVGYGTAYVVGTGIVKANVKEIEMDMSQDNDLSALTDQQSHIRVAADPLVTLAASGASLLYPAFLLGFAAMDIDKEPRELLPKGKA
ncbi:MAG: ABC transporter permease [Oscillospiraceae bacterium]|nr:ABC transporter permease [Oscillospiraceae bacterium]